MTGPLVTTARWGAFGPPPAPRGTVPDPGGADDADDGRALRTALAGRYAVERELGRGGMGVVFLARDLRHGRDVALKVLGRAVATGAAAERFLAEIRVTAGLRHPHILPLFDSGTAAGRLYYVAPHVEGGTLRDRIARDGALPLDDVLRVLREVAEALAHAHARGVVHRDVKPENVLLGEGGAVLGDFGIARAVAKADAAGAPDGPTAVTRPGLGTPDYMAPEQAAGDAPVDHRADLYALGVLAHEMLAGRRPDDEAPASLVAVRADVPAALDALVARLRARRPDDRVASAVEVLQVLRTIGTTATGGSATEPVGAHTPRALLGAGRRARTVAALGAATLAALAAVAALRGGGGAGRAAGQSAPSAARVLVLPFENATGDPALAPLGRMAADWVAQGLAQTGVVEVAFDPTWRDSAGAGLRAAAAENGAATVVSGAYYLDGDSVRVQARVTDVAAARLLRPIEMLTAPRTHAAALLPPLRERVMAVLAVAKDPRFAGWDVGAAPPTYAAYEQLVTGIDLFSRGDARGALGHWARGAALDSTFAQPRLYAAMTYVNMAAYATADSLLAGMERRRASLSPFDRAMLGYVRASIDGDRAAVLASGRAMVAVAPAAPLARYLHGLAAVNLNRPREALATLAIVERRLGHSRASWSAQAYWGRVTEAYHALGAHDRELAAARRGRGVHPDDRAILGYELRALAALGHLEALRAALERLDAMPATPGESPLPAILTATAGELLAHGHPAAARDVLRRQLAWQDARPAAERRTAAAREARARALYLLGDYEAADAAYARLAAAAPEDPGHVARRGLIAARRGRTAVAQAAAARLRTLGVAYDRGQTTFLRAQLATALGDSAGALLLVEQALSEGTRYPQVHAHPDLAPLAASPRLARLLRPTG